MGDSNSFSVLCNILQNMHPSEGHPYTSYFDVILQEYSGEYPKLVITLLFI